MVFIPNHVIFTSTHVCMLLRTVNDESLAWLKFCKFYLKCKQILDKIRLWMNKICDVVKICQTLAMLNFRRLRYTNTNSYETVSYSTYAVNLASMA